MYQKSGRKFQQLQIGLASPKEIKEATIRKVEYRPQPGTGLNELHLDLPTTDDQSG